MWLYFTLPGLFVLCSNNQGLNYSLRARTGGSSVDPLCPCGMGTLGALALSIPPNFMELWQDNLGPHGCCTARPGNLRKNPSVSSLNFISSSQKYSGRVSLSGEGAIGGNGKPGHMWVCCGIPTSCAPWTTSLIDCQSFSQTSTERKITIKTLNTRHTSWDKRRQHPRAQ